MKRGFWVLVLLTVSVFLSHVESHANGLEKIYTVTVDYSKSIEEMIQQGQYVWVHPKIKNLLVKGKTKVEKKLTLFNFDYLVSIDKVLVEMEKRDLRPATLEDLLVFHAQYPKHEDNIIALGTFLIVDKSRLFPTLYRFQGQEGFGLLLSSNELRKNNVFFSSSSITINQ